MTQRRQSQGSSGGRGRRRRLCPDMVLSSACCCRLIEQSRSSPSAFEAWNPAPAARALASAQPASRFSKTRGNKTLPWKKGEEQSKGWYVFSPHLLSSWPLWGAQRLTASSSSRTPSNTWCTRLQLRRRSTATSVRARLWRAGRPAAPARSLIGARNVRSAALRGVAQRRHAQAAARSVLLAEALGFQRLEF